MPSVQQSIREIHNNPTTRHSLSMTLTSTQSLLWSFKQWSQVPSTTAVRKVAMINSSKII